MRNTLVLVGFLLLATVAAKQRDEPPTKGAIYGVAIGQDGHPTKGISLTDFPLGVAIAATLPHTRTNDTGEYRFQKTQGQLTL